MPGALEAALYDGYFEPPAEGFAAVVDGLCAAHPEHRGPLRAHADAITLGDSALDKVQQPLQEPALPTAIGAYRVVALLGQGGFGTVYKAEQTEPVHRTVAIKVLHPDRADERSRMRFTLERQTLARMQHPGIAQIHDAGQTEGGLLYFAMEFVDGAPITAWCDRHRVDLGGRLERFLDVCRAVQHAHQRGVVHRDIKPSNVMVCGGPEDPAVKVIDFGVAKILLEDEGLPVRTAEGSLVGTPGYMSPEQASGGGVDTRTDVYALGVLLYELLTGALPFSATELGSRNPLELAKVICEADPRPLSQAVRDRSGTGGDVAAARGTDPEGLTRQLRTDIAWVVRRALGKDPEQRYASVAGLAADVQRYQSGQPVEAREHRAVYLLRRFVARHRFGVAVTAAVVLVTIAGVLGLLWSLKQVESARREAVERQREAEVSSYAANLSAAGSALRIGNVPTAIQHLDAAAPEHRGWEWDYLRAQCDMSLDRIQGRKEVQRVAWLDEDRLLVFYGDSSGDLWRRSTGELEPAFGPAGIEGDDLLWDPDHGLLVLDCRDRLVRVDPRSLELTPIRDNPSDVRSMAASPDGRVLWVSDNSGAITTIDLLSGFDRTLAVAPVFAWDLTFVPGHGLAVGLGTLDGQVEMYDVVDGRLLWTVTVNSHPVVSLCHGGDPAGALFAGARTRLVRLDPGTGAVLGATRLQESTRELQLSRDGAILVGAGKQRSLQVWRADTLEPDRSMHGHTGITSGLALHPDGDGIATSSFDGTVRLWSLRGRSSVAELPAGVHVQDLSVATDQSRFAAVDAHGRVSVWNAADLSLHSSFEVPRRLLGCALVGDRLYLSGDGLLAVDLATGVEEEGDGPGGMLGRIAVDPEGRWLVGVRYPAGALHLWSLPGMELVHSEPVQASDRIAWDEGAGAFLVGSAEAGLRWFDPRARAVVRTEAAPDMRFALDVHGDLIVGGMGVAYHRSGDAGGFVPSGVTDTLSAMAIHPSGDRVLLSGHEPLVRVMNRDMDVLLILDGLRKPVVRFGFLDGGRRILGLCGLPGDRGTVMVWSPGG